MFKVGVLPLDGFALMSYASLVEPFRAANLLSEIKYYEVINFSMSRQGSISSSGLKIEGNYYLGDFPDLDIFFVVAGGDPFKYNNKNLYVTDGNQYFNRPGPRLIDSVEILAEIFHPNTFNFGHQNKGWINFFDKR